MLGLCCSAGFPLAGESCGSALVVLKLLIAVVSLVAEHGLYDTPASVALACGLSCCGTWA